ncbi:MAG: hypothetical protein QOE47_607 [Pyrinomonadaceae bacterium]|nr:hypothetical protein [Pyrinomonadaceae bacterium]
MLKKITSLVIVGLLLNLTFAAPVRASTRPEKEAKFVAELKTKLATFGSGPEAQVKVTLRDKTKLRGYVSEVSDAHFVVVDPKTSISTTVFYPQVKQVAGHNLSTGGRIAVGLALSAALLIVVFMIVGKYAGD